MKGIISTGFKPLAPAHQPVQLVGSHENITTMMDPDAKSHLLDNLISNALHHGARLLDENIDR